MDDKYLHFYTKDGEIVYEEMVQCKDCKYGLKEKYGIYCINMEGTLDYFGSCFMGEKREEGEDDGDVEEKADLSAYMNYPTTSAIISLEDLND